MKARISHHLNFLQNAHILQIYNNHVLIFHRTPTCLLEYASHTLIICYVCAPCLWVYLIVATIYPHAIINVGIMIRWVR
jgi:hypothetical protein